MPQEKLDKMWTLLRAGAIEEAEIIVGELEDLADERELTPKQLEGYFGGAAYLGAIDGDFEMLRSSLARASMESVASPGMDVLVGLLALTDGDRIGATDALQRAGRDVSTLQGQGHLKCEVFFGLSMAHACLGDLDRGGFYAEMAQDFCLDAEAQALKEGVQRIFLGMDFEVPKIPSALPQPKGKRRRKH